MSQQSDDRNLEEYLDRQSEVSRRYGEIAKTEVPPHLDQAILARAAQAVRLEKKPAQPMRSWTRWTPLLALAASMVLTLTIVIESGVQKESVTVAFPKRQAQQSTEVELEEDGAPRELSDNASALSQDVVPAAPSVAEKSSVASEPAPISAAQSRPPAAPAPQSKGVEGVEVSAFRRQDQVNNVPTAVPSEVSEAEEPAQESLSATSPAADGVDASDAVAASTDERAKREAAANQSARENRAFGGRAAPASVEDVAVTAARRRAEPSGIAGPRHTLPRESGPTEAQLDKAQREASPTLWLQYIRELRADDKARQANSEWRAFREAYPDAVVAEDDTAREPR